MRWKSPRASACGQGSDRSVACRDEGARRGARDGSRGEIVGRSAALGGHLHPISRRPVIELVRLINERILTGQASTLDVLYSRFVSFFSQVPAIERVLPLQESPSLAGTVPPVVEPGSAALLDALLPHFLEVRLFDAVVQAFSAEHAARMVAMQNAKSNAIEIADTFTLLYNKTRQERITSEILDLGNKGKKK